MLLINLNSTSKEPRLAFVSLLNATLNNGKQEGIRTSVWIEDIDIKPDKGESVSKQSVYTFVFRLATVKCRTPHQISLNFRHWLFICIRQHLEFVTPLGEKICDNGSYNTD